MTGDEHPLPQGLSGLICDGEGDLWGSRQLNQDPAASTIFNETTPAFHILRLYNGKVPKTKLSCAQQRCRWQTAGDSLTSIGEQPQATQKKHPWMIYCDVLGWHSLAYVHGLPDVQGLSLVLGACTSYRIVLKIAQGVTLWLTLPQNIFNARNAFSWWGCWKNLGSQHLRYAKKSDAPMKNTDWHKQWDKQTNLRSPRSILFWVLRGCEHKERHVLMSCHF